MSVETGPLRGIADADRRDQGVPEWRRSYGEDVLALCDEVELLRRVAATATEVAKPRPAWAQIAALRNALDAWRGGAA